MRSYVQSPVANDRSGWRNVRLPRHVRNHRSRRERRSDNRPLLPDAEPPPPLGVGENMNLCHTRTASRTGANTTVS